jgi:hypothetical protein
MALDVHITNPENGCKVGTSTHEFEPNALIVATRPYREYMFQDTRFFNDTYSANMAQSVGYGGSPEIVYDENDNWVASALSGTWTFNSTDNPQAGTYCIDGASATDNNEFKLRRSSDLIISHVAVTGYIYVEEWGSKGTKELRIFFTDSNGAQVGNTLSISSYVDKQLYDTWQKFQIPIEHFLVGGQTVRELHFRHIDNHPQGDLDYRLDTIQIEESGGAITYTLEPPAGSHAYIREMQGTFIDNWVGSPTNADMVNLSYDQILGRSKLTNGILIKYYLQGQLAGVENLKCIGDMIGRAGSEITAAIQDTTNTLISISWKYELGNMFHGHLGDRIEIVIQDDMSNFLSFYVSGRWQFFYTEVGI